jgi:hypothetical protein
MEQVPTGIKHILPTGKQEVNKISQNQKKGEFSASWEKI